MLFPRYIISTKGAAVVKGKWLWERRKKAVRFFVLAILCLPAVFTILTMTGGVAETTSRGQRADPVTITKKTVTETVPVPHQENIVEDPTFQAGYSEITTPGQDGTKSVTYEVTYMNGVMTSKKELNQAITVPPVDEVTSIGPFGSSVQVEPYCQADDGSC